MEAGPLPAGWVMVVRDVSERLAVQMQLQHQERLAAVGQLAAGIAHDFNNIMSVIITYAELTGQSPNLTEREQDRLVIIREQALRATAMIRQILDFSRRSVMELQTLDLLPILKEQQRLLARTLPESIEIKLEYEPADYVIKADLTRVQQMLMNLAVNARDAMPEGGRLTVSLAHVTAESPRTAPLPTMASGPWVRLQVTDTGTGIAPQDMAHIFEPFFTTKAAGAGTGLGLAQVHGIVAQHNGHITVDSAVDAGTTFTIYLPAVVLLPAAEAPNHARLAAMAHGHGEAILVVEDEDALRATLVDFLETLNYLVIEATDGAGALEILADRAEPFDLILSDVVMPRMGGVALFKNLVRRGNSTPVVLLTGHTMGVELEGLKEHGLAGWLPKPPPLAELAALLARLLEP